MNYGGPIIAGAVAVLLMSYVFVTVIFGIARRRSSRGIARRLTKPGGRVDVHIPRVHTLFAPEGTWNPAKPDGTRNWITKPGRGTYWLDEAGLVHLDYVPDLEPLQADGGDAEERMQHFVGPLPDAFRPGSPTYGRGRHVYRVVALSHPAFMVVGFLLGYFVTAGSSAARFEGGGVGILLGFFGGWLVVHVLVLVLGVRGLRQKP